MAIIKSAKKAARQSVKRKAVNLVYKNNIKNLVKEVRSLILVKKTEQAKNMLPKLYKAFDKAAKKGVIKKNTASRKKSRLTRLLAKSIG
ncbi:MAG: 30S ribosomal protein S20 [Patescibacteria group bacterium]